MRIIRLNELSKATLLSFLNKAALFLENRYYSLGMIAVAAAAVAVEWNLPLGFELRSFNHKKNSCVYSLIFKAFFV